MAWGSDSPSARLSSGRTAGSLPQKIIQIAVQRYVSPFWGTTTKGRHPHEAAKPLIAFKAIRRGRRAQLWKRQASIIRDRTKASERTIKAHRAQMMHKMEVQSPVELGRVG